VVLPNIVAAKDWSAGLGAEVDFNWNATNGVTLRWVQGNRGQEHVERVNVLPRVQPRVQARQQSK